MFVRINTTPNSPRKSVQIVESIRKGDQVKQKIVRYVGIAMDDQELEKLKDLANEIIPKLEKERNSQLPLFEEFGYSKKRGRKKAKSLEDILPVDQVKLNCIQEEKRIVDGFHEVAGKLYDDLGFNTLLKKKIANKILKNMILARLASPNSKRKTQAFLQTQFDKNYNLSAIYRMMDELFEALPRIKTCVYQNTLNLFPDKIDLVLFDVTTLYFESTVDDELRKFGYSKDQKYHCTQVVLALATNADGLPIGYELFEGNKAETTTLLYCLEEWKKSLPIQNVTLVADRAMCSRKNLEELDKAGISYVVAMPLRRSLKNAQQQEILNDKNYTQCQLEEQLLRVQNFEWEGKRIVVTHSEKRALKDKHDRDKLINKLMKKAKNGRVKNLVSNRGYLKYIEENGEPGEFVIDDDKISKDAVWDGFHAILTNIKDMSEVELLSRYHRLWVIEESFRINKHNLAMRPIFHHTPQRIYAHIGLCYLTFALLRQLQYRIRIAQKPMSVDAIREALASVQSSIHIHKQTKDRYRVPGKFSNAAHTIYKAIGVQRSQDASIYL